MSNTTMPMWPFQPLASLSLDEQRMWLAQCYVPSDVDSVVLDPRRSVIVIAPPGHGLSTSLALLHSQQRILDSSPSEAARPPHLLTFSYPPEQWPGQPHALCRTDTEGHFKQLMAQVADQCVQKLEEHPALIQDLPLSGHEFLAWLIGRYLGRRWSNRWLLFLEQNEPSADIQQLIEQVRQGELDHLLSDMEENVRLQIVESLDLARHLGWNGIYAVIDISITDWLERSLEQQVVLRDGVRQLLENLQILQRPGFGCKIGLPAVMFSRAEAQALVRDRAEVITYAWTPEKLLAIGDRVLSAAIERHLALEPLLAPKTWALLDEDIRMIWGHTCPAAMTAIAKQVRQLQLQQVNLNTDRAKLALRRQLYIEYAPLRHNPHSSRPVIWRGVTQLSLGETPLRVFEILWKRRGSNVSNDELLLIAGSDKNLDKIISRIRQVIEPLPRPPIYLHRSQSYGTWLEHCVFE